MTILLLLYSSTAYRWLHSSIAEREREGRDNGLFTTLYQGWWQSWIFEIAENATKICAVGEFQLLMMMMSDE